MSDIEIAQKTVLMPIGKIAAKLSIDNELLEPYGKTKAKLPLTLIDDEKAKKSKLILVSAISPTPAGEGKTTTSIGLNEGLNKLGKKSLVVLREPSLGPVFGMKGGATGGGYSQVVPMEDINLHFTGDFSAVEKAHNLLCAMVDNTIQAKNPLVKIDPRTVVIKRVMDMNDRSLRNIIIALGGKSNGHPRESGFDIGVASEVMAILCMSLNLNDLKERLGKMYIGKSYDNKPVFAKDIKANGAMAALLKDAVKPNLVQTLEGNPAIIHGGPFANIAQGTNTIIATKMGLSLSDYVVTEAGFAFDLGGEKFLDIKSRYAKLKPQVVVIVCTVRALKFHGGAAKDALGERNDAALRAGAGNLKRHLENVKKFNLEAVVAVNNFPTDHQEELDLVKQLCNELGVKVALSEVWAKGGEGGIELAKAVLDVIDNQEEVQFTPIYDLKLTIKEKIEKIATEIYRAGKVTYTAKALRDIRLAESLGLSDVPICIAKTQYSFSDNAKMVGAPTEFEFNIREVEVAAGAGFVVAIAGNIMRMPGLPNNPAAENIDIDENGNITGLF